MENEKELQEDFRLRVKKNFERLSGDTYAGKNIFRETSYGWPGDWEGRYLLACVLLRRLTGRAPESLTYLLEHLDEHTNRYGYFGTIADGESVSEQQLSGNGWFLRGLCEYYIDSPSRKLREKIESIAENLYFKSEALYAKYPVTGIRVAGGVSGNTVEETQGWKLSSDVGCAFIALDGLTATYALFPSERLKKFIDDCIRLFLEIDKCAVKMQTHAMLTCCRGILRMYGITREAGYLRSAQDIFSLYTAHGMTLTYENFNWFGHEDSWTEPCAVIDSLIVAFDLYEATADTTYRTLARRIWLNGFRLCQRDNGGAGTNKCVTNHNGIWSINTYEAPFCCSMRTAEGLYRAGQSLDILLTGIDESGGCRPVQDEYGRWICGDRLFCSVDGNKLEVLPNILKIGEDSLKKKRLQIVFADGKSAASH